MRVVFDASKPDPGSWILIDTDVCGPYIRDWSVFLKAAQDFAEASHIKEMREREEDALWVMVRRCSGLWPIEGDKLTELVARANNTNNQFLPMSAISRRLIVDESIRRYT